MRFSFHVRSSFQCLSSLDMKAFTEGARTASLGSEFHTFTSRLENIFALTFNLERLLYSLMLLLLVVVLSMTVKNLFILT